MIAVDLELKYIIAQSLKLESKITMLAIVFDIITAIVCIVLVPTIMALIYLWVSFFFLGMLVHSYHDLVTSRTLLALNIGYLYASADSEKRSADRRQILNELAAAQENYEAQKNFKNYHSLKFNDFYLATYQYWTRKYGG